MVHWCKYKRNVAETAFCLRLQIKTESRHRMRKWVDLHLFAPLIVNTAWGKKVDVHLFAQLPAGTGCRNQCFRCFLALVHFGLHPISLIANHAIVRPAATYSIYTPNNTQLMWQFIATVLETSFIGFSQLRRELRILEEKTIISIPIIITIISQVI